MTDDGERVTRTRYTIDDLGGVGKERHFGPVGKVKHWLLIEGSRLGLSLVAAAATALLTLALVRAGVIAVGPRSSIQTLFASGVTSGLLTLITVALSINQLVLSRVFGSPNELVDRYQGALELRDEVSSATGPGRPSVETMAFISTVGETLAGRAVALRAEIPEESGGAWDHLRSYADAIESYGTHVATVDPETMTTPQALTTLLSSEYAYHVSATEAISAEYDAQLSAEASERLSTIADLLGSVAVVRQYLKTLALQQELARLSRLIAYTGFLALLVAIYVTLVYRGSNGAVLPASWLPYVASAAVGVVVTPLAVLITYVLRVATIARFTVSVGPFFPPESRLAEQ